MISQQTQFEEIHAYNITEKQLKQLKEFQEKIYKDLTSKTLNLDENQINYYTHIDHALRFLNAREFNEQKAYQMWEKWYQWHLQYRPDLISSSEECIQKQLKTGKLFWHKFDKDKRPCLYYRMKFHVPKLVTIDESIRFFLFMMEQGIKESERLGNEGGKVCVIYDRRGYSKQQYDENAMKTMKQLMPILQDYYSERLSRFYVLGANWFYRAAFKVVSTFMSKKTQDKVKVLASDNELLQYFYKQNLLQEYGGDSDPSQGTGINLKVEQGAYVKISQQKDQEVEDDEEDQQKLQEMQKKMYQDAGIKN